MLKRILLVTLCWLGCATVGSATPLGSGDVFPSTTLPDQHGESATIGADTAVVLFAADKVASELLNGFLEKQPDGFLTRHRAVYVADISEMPSMITRLFALPKMRKRPYRILLASEPGPLSFLPRSEAMVTAIRLDGGRVVDVRFFQSEAGLALAF